jgi:hypothetical protein
MTLNRDSYEDFCPPQFGGLSRYGRVRIFLTWTPHSDLNIHLFQTTCLEVLDNLLKDVKCEREYNSTMTNIPSGPLLNLLHYQNDVESPLHAGITETTDATTGKKRKTSRYVF